MANFQSLIALNEDLSYQLVYARLQLREAREQRDLLEMWEFRASSPQDLVRRVMQANRVVKAWEDKIDRLWSQAEDLQNKIIECCSLLVLA